MINSRISKQCSINFILIFSVLFLLIIPIFFSPVFAQVKVLQCSPGQATVNNNLLIKGDLTVDNKAVIKNDLIVNKDIYAASGAQRIWLGNNTSSPFITNNGDGVLFYSMGGQNFLWKSFRTSPNEEAMTLDYQNFGIPADREYSLRVYGRVEAFRSNSQIIHLDSQGLGTTSPNVLKLTMAGQTDNGGALFHNGSDSLVLGALNADGSLGSDLLAVNTASGNTTIKGLITSSGTPVCLQNGNGCPPVALTGAGTTDRLARWTTGSNIGDSVIQDNGANIGIGGAPTGDKLNVSGNARVDGDIRWTGTLQGGAVPWARLTSFPTACSSGQYVEGVGGALTCKQVAWSEVGGWPGVCPNGQFLTNMGTGACGTAGTLVAGKWCKSDGTWVNCNNDLVEKITAGAGISISGPIGDVTVSNVGVTSITAGAGINISGATGNVTVSAIGQSFSLDCQDTPFIEGNSGTNNDPTAYITYCPAGYLVTGTERTNSGKMICCRVL